MLRIIAMMLTCALWAAPAVPSAAGQTMQRSATETASLSASGVQFSSTPLAVERGDRFHRMSAAASTQSAFGQAGTFAAAVFRVLVSQNTIDIDGMPASEMDAVLRPPEAGSESSGPSLFRDAKRLYDSATSFRTERAIIHMDPLSLKCRVRVNLGRLTGGSK